MAIRFAVRDSGPGISPSVQARLFQPFSQGDASIARRHGGTGLGLTISRRLVALMQGEMGVDSEEGQGSTFWCLIPLKPATGSVPTHVTLHTPARPSRRRPVQPLVGSSPRTRILLAEDNAINQQLVVRLLERVGYRVDVAANGQEALESHQRAPCDAILMDYQIPEMSGLTATAEIRRREGITTHTPIIAMTADCRQEDRDRCIGIGMDDLIPKPLDRDVLYETLGRVLGASTEPECSKPDVH